MSYVDDKNMDSIYCRLAPVESRQDLEIKDEARELETGISAKEGSGMSRELESGMYAKEGSGKSRELESGISAKEESGKAILRIEVPEWKYSSAFSLF